MYCCINGCVGWFIVSSRRRHTMCALVTGVQTCALPISRPSASPFRASEGRPDFIFSDGSPYPFGAVELFPRPRIYRAFTNIADSRGEVRRSEEVRFHGANGEGPSLSQERGRRAVDAGQSGADRRHLEDRKSTRLNSSH